MSSAKKDKNNPILDTVDVEESEKRYQRNDGRGTVFFVTKI